MPHVVAPDWAEPNPIATSVASCVTPRSATATHFIRKMRGTSQAHLLMADDEQAYVVKFSNNPQHLRSLVNEFIASALFVHLRISTPETGIIRITEEFLGENPEVYLDLGNRRCAVQPGRHFGSCYPGDPNYAHVYDFLPDPMLAAVVNASHFLGALVVGKWMANSDPRQSIFIRAPPETTCSPSSRFIVQMVDHGSAFDGAGWRFRDSPLGSVYFRPSVYPPADMAGLFQPWLDLVGRFPEEVLSHSIHHVPDEWLAGDDHSRLEGLVEGLLLRRSGVADLIGAYVELRKLSLVQQ
jgi:hypothetical protein